MIVPINEDHRINSDELQWITQQRKVTLTGVNKGQVNWDNISFHTSLESAIKSLGERLIRRSTADTLEKVVQEFKFVNETLSEARNGYLKVLNANLGIQL